MGKTNLGYNKYFNWIGNGSFFGGKHVHNYNVGSSGNSNHQSITAIANPGASDYVLSFSPTGGPLVGDYEVHPRIGLAKYNEGSTGRGIREGLGLQPNTTYKIRAWVYEQAAYDGDPRLLHARWYHGGGNSQVTGIPGVGTCVIFEEKMVNGVIWKHVEETLITNDTPTGDVKIYFGYPGNSTAGYRFMTGLELVEENPEDSVIWDNPSIFSGFEPEYGAFFESDEGTSHFDMNTPKVVGFWEWDTYSAMPDNGTVMIADTTAIPAGKQWVGLTQNSIQHCIRNYIDCSSGGDHDPANGWSEDNLSKEFRPRDWKGPSEANSVGYSAFPLIQQPSVGDDGTSLGTTSTILGSSTFQNSQTAKSKKGYTPGFSIMLNLESKEEGNGIPGTDVGHLEDFFGGIKAATVGAELVHFVNQSETIIEWPMASIPAGGIRLKKNQGDYTRPVWEKQFPMYMLILEIPVTVSFPAQAKTRLGHLGTEFGNDTNATGIAIKDPSTGNKNSITSATPNILTVGSHTIEDTAQGSVPSAVVISGAWEVPAGKKWVIFSNPQAFTGRTSITNTGANNTEDDFEDFYTRYGSDNWGDRDIPAYNFKEPKINLYRPFSALNYWPYVDSQGDPNTTTQLQYATTTGDKYWGWRESGTCENATWTHTHDGGEEHWRNDPNPRAFAWHGSFSNHTDANPGGGDWAYHTCEWYNIPDTLDGVPVDADPANGCANPTGPNGADGQPTCTRCDTWGDGVWNTWQGGSGLSANDACCCCGGGHTEAEDGINREKWDRWRYTDVPFSFGDDDNYDQHGNVIGYDTHPYSRYFPFPTYAWIASGTQDDPSAFELLHFSNSTFDIDKYLSNPVPTHSGVTWYETIDSGSFSFDIARNIPANYHWANVLVSSGDSLIKGVLKDNAGNVFNLGKSIPSGTIGTDLNLLYLTTNAPLLAHDWDPSAFSISDFQELQTAGWDAHTQCSFNWMLLELPDQDTEEMPLVGNDVYSPYIQPKVIVSGSDGVKINSYHTNDLLSYNDGNSANNLAGFIYWLGGSASGNTTYTDTTNLITVVSTGPSGSGYSHIQVYRGGLSVVSGKRYRVRFKASLTGNSNIDRPINIKVIKHSADWDHYHPDAEATKPFIIKHSSTRLFYEKIITCDTTAADGRLDFMIGNGMGNALYDAAFTMTFSDVEFLPEEAELNTTLNANTPVLKYSNVFESTYPTCVNTHGTCTLQTGVPSVDVNYDTQSSCVSYGGSWTSNAWGDEQNLINSHTWLTGAYTCSAIDERAEASNSGLGGGSNSLCACGGGNYYGATGDGILDTYHDITTSYFVIPDGKKWNIIIQPYKSFAPATSDESSNYENIFFDGWTANGIRKRGGLIAKEGWSGEQNSWRAWANMGDSTIKVDTINQSSQFLKQGVLAKRVEEEDDGTFTLTNSLSSGEYDWLKVKCSKSYVGFSSAQIVTAVNNQPGTLGAGDASNPIVEEGTWNPDTLIGEVQPQASTETGDQSHVEYGNKFLVLIFEVNDDS